MRTDKLQLPLNLLLKLLLWFGIIGAIAYGAICLLLFIQQPRFIFFPSSVIEETPEMFKLPYKEVWLPVPGRSLKVEHIHGWWLEAKQPNAKVLLYLHGNGLNIGANIAHASAW